MASKLGDIADHIGAELHGDADSYIHAIAPLEDASSGCISFLSNRRYVRQLKSTKASAVILSSGHLDDCPVQALVMDNPYLGYALTAQLLYPQKKPAPGINDSAVVDASAQVHSSATIDALSVVKAGACIAANVHVGPGCIISEDVEIGQNTHLVADVTIAQHVKIGSRVLIHPGVVIGADGFGLAEKPDGSWVKIPQIGNVVISDDVEIGANTTIDRGALGDTVIETGVKIDNQVQIGHNVHIGQYTAIAGCTGIAGSARIGRRCRIGGGCGIGGHLEIADDVIITGMTVVNNSITQAGVYSSPLTVTDNKTWRRNVARFHRLDQSLKNIYETLGQKKDS